ncbi:hypothetical protein JMJ56_24655 [Belnapia sp. T18]|uniref:Uncharacterized protein n=1 Tax=Belnapia arida TaxID=2804533 RepID=A0ABS1U973_9PROT|nr:hypothetical protein [Belnapia arida]MBL6081194.1 hypothetical protein [Belnapia arida]
MPKKRHTAEQIIGLLRQAEVGLAIPHKLLADPASLTRPLLLTSNSRTSRERLSVALAKQGCQPVGEPMCRLRPRNCAAALLALMQFSSAAPLVAAVEEPIELADDPFQITDPVAAKPGAAEAAFIGAYERARQGSVRNTGAAETQLSMGVVPSLELRIGQVGAYGNLETRRKLGTVSDDLGSSDNGG